MIATSKHACSRKAALHTAVLLLACILLLFYSKRVYSDCCFIFFDVSTLSALCAMQCVFCTLNACFDSFQIFSLFVEFF